MAKTDPPTSPPDSLTLLIGAPRSGTTLIGNAFMSHSTVCGIHEPYQRVRKDGYETTNLAAFQNDYDLDFAKTPNLAMKETTTRLRNVELSLGLAQNAQQNGIYTGLVLILRCPFEAFLSQVEASREHWEEKKLTEITEDNVAHFFTRQRAAIRLICENARRFHFRIASYDRFCAAPETEIARLMALIPVSLEPHQKALMPDETIVGAADPKFASSHGGVKKTDRATAVEQLIETYQHLPSVKFAVAQRALIALNPKKMTDIEKLDALTALAL
ncbi:hypothetical protein SAMN05444287_1760 [Octadecabacter temperatus]|uniref:Uncharacterized protein n=1 Tax=Octadecabacter temperatus TaxID=1458307 RepID=A0A0K0Y6P4_9RHOB|nr:sulfotransferase family protein [Octadecabacter temperatus]AKS46643.1 hypothetical protein OSB_21040 [Octadecabacter temperatus]SIO18411.1 hypothetical protein SAMN05444287_1760 [Octadecabacter temperatus]